MQRIRPQLGMFYRYRLYTDETQTKLIHRTNCLSVANAKHEHLGGALYKGEKLLISRPYKGRRNLR